MFRQFSFSSQSWPYMPFAGAPWGDRRLLKPMTWLRLAFTMRSSGSTTKTVAGSELCNQRAFLAFYSTLSLPASFSCSNPNVLLHQLEGKLWETWKTSKERTFYRNYYSSDHWRQLMDLDGCRWYAFSASWGWPTSGTNRKVSALLNQRRNSISKGNSSPTLTDDS